KSLSRGDTNRSERYIQCGSVWALVPPVAPLARLPFAIPSHCVSLSALYYNARGRYHQKPAQSSCRPTGRLEQTSPLQRVHALPSHIVPTMARTCALGRGNPPAALGPPPDWLEVHSPTCSSADPAPTPASAHKPRKPHTSGLGALSCLEPDHERRVAQRHRRSPVWHGLKSALHACRLVM